MKKIVLGIAVLVTVVVFTACLKSKDPGCPYTDQNVKAADSIVNSLKATLDSRGIVPTGKDTSGVFYEILTPGTGDTANVCSAVLVNYKGSFLSSGEIFDQTTTSPVAFNVGRLIVGFQKGLKHIGVGGKIRMYIPYPLGYGVNDTKDMTTGAVIIPGKSNLVFEVELIKVQN